MKVPIFSYTPPWGTDTMGGLDVMFLDDVEIKIRRDGKVVWVNSPTCVLRLCQIEGKITIIDERQDNDKAEEQLGPTDQEAPEGS